MSVTVRPYRRGGWEADIRVTLPDGSTHRRRWKTPVTSKSAAKRWGEDCERVWYGELRNPKPKPEPPKEVPTLAEFKDRFLDGYARANRQKPSGIAAKETILAVHLGPALGNKKLDAITNEDVQRLKMRLTKKAPKTVNNVLTVLNTVLKVAVDWQIIQRMPCSIKLLKATKPSAGFHDFGEYERLVEAAKRDPQAYVIVLLGGEAGLRCGEMRALQWTDVDLVRRRLTVQRSEWEGHVTEPKGGRLRYVPLTVRLTAALREHRHLRSSLVLCQVDGTPMTRQQVQYRVKQVARRANVRDGVHVLRHTFCSHLAMRGAPARAIQELAGHSELGTTQRYMHLTISAIDAAIRLLDSPGVRSGHGDSEETGFRAEERSMARTT